MCLVASHSPLLAQGAWSRVPPTPTSCFADDGAFDKGADAAKATLTAEIKAQQTYRAEIQQKMNAVDPATIGTRMAAYLQKDPAKAQQYLQMMGATGDPSAEPAVSKLVTRKADLETQLATMIEDFQTESGDLVPAARDVRTTYAERQNDPRAVAIMNEWNTKYQKLCEAKLLSGPFADWLKQYKDVHTEMIQQEILTENRLKLQAEIYGVPMPGFKSVAEQQSVESYISYMQRVYRVRKVRMKPS